jgi:hypothetical protein
MDCVLLSGDEATRCRDSTEGGNELRCFREPCESAPSQKNAVPPQTSQVSLTKLRTRKNQGVMVRLRTSSLSRSAKAPTVNTSCFFPAPRTRSARLSDSASRCPTTAMYGTF